MEQDINHIPKSSPLYVSPGLNTRGSTTSDPPEIAASGEPTRAQGARDRIPHDRHALKVGSPGEWRSALKRPAASPTAEVFSKRPRPTPASERQDVAELYDRVAGRPRGPSGVDPTDYIGGARYIAGTVTGVIVADHPKLQGLRLALTCRHVLKANRPEDGLSLVAACYPGAGLVTRGGLSLAAFEREDPRTRDGRFDWSLALVDTGRVMPYDGIRYQNWNDRDPQAMRQTDHDLPPKRRYRDSRPYPNKEEWLHFATGVPAPLQTLTPGTRVYKLARSGLREFEVVAAAEDLTVGSARKNESRRAPAAMALPVDYAPGGGHERRLLKEVTSKERMTNILHNSADSGESGSCFYVKNADGSLSPAGMYRGKANVRVHLDQHAWASGYAPDNLATWPRACQLQPLEGVFRELHAHPALAELRRAFGIPHDEALGFRFATPGDTMDPNVTRPAFQRAAMRLGLGPTRLV
jgi:hypothetical protein